MRTTTTPSTRRALALLLVAGTACGALALGGAPADASVVPVGPGPIATPTPTLPRPCAITIGGCRVDTAFSFHHNGQTVYAASTFPQSSSGTVRYRMSCPDGYTVAKTVTITGTRTWATLTNRGDHPVSQTCTVTQNVASSYDTVAYLGEPDPDELWFSTHVEFFNVPKN